MTAAAERAALAAIGQDLMAVAGNAGERRAAALLTPSTSHRTTSFADITAAPAWLRLPRDEQRLIARRAAMLAMGPTIATSIDGEWLSDLARATDDETLDWAIERADQLPDSGLPALAAIDLEAVGFTMMRAALPASLVTYLDWKPMQPPQESSLLQPLSPDTSPPAFFATRDHPPSQDIEPKLHHAGPALSLFCVAEAAKGIA